MANHTIRIEQGVVSSPAEPNQNPSVASSPTEGRGQSPTGNIVSKGMSILVAKQLYSGIVQNIGFATGNYELQEKYEVLTKVGAGAIGFIAAPIPAAIVGTITAGFSIYKTTTIQNRNAYRQQQQQVLTGKISTNGGEWL